jgi:hypothetical protein
MQPQATRPSQSRCTFSCRCFEAEVTGLFLQDLQHVRTELAVVQNHNHHSGEDDEGNRRKKPSHDGKAQVVSAQTIVEGFCGQPDHAAGTSGENVAIELTGRKISTAVCTAKGISRTSSLARSVVPKSANKPPMMMVVDEKRPAYSTSSA